MHWRKAKICTKKKKKECVTFMKQNTGVQVKHKWFQHLQQKAQWAIVSATD